MFLKNKDVEFNLMVEGYEFPHIKNTAYDSNWLNVAVKVKHPRGSWSHTDACLLTWELKALAEWLKNLAKGEPAASEIDFLEPELWFEVTKGKLKVHLDYEMRPPWLPPAETESASNSVCLTFETEPEALKEAVNSLQYFSKRFPTRVGV